MRNERVEGNAGRSHRPTALALSHTHSMSGDANPPRELSVALPLCLLLRNTQVIHGRLDIPHRVNGSRYNGVLTRSGLLPLQGPELPREFGFLLPVDGRWQPWPTVDLHLHSLDGSAPRRADNPVLAVLAGHFCGDQH